MNEVLEFLTIMEIPEEDAMKALLTAFSPLDPGALRGVWCQSIVYGNTAPSTKEIWSIYVKADFRCSQCGSQRRLTLDHINGDTTDHSPDNLTALCFDCNRAKSGRRTKDRNHRLRVYRSTLKLFRQLNRFPTQKEILVDSGVNQISGTTYMLKYLEKRLRDKVNREYEFNASKPVS